MNICSPPCSDSSTLLSQRLIEALGWFQAQTPDTILGSIYVYDLVEQRTLYASYSVAAMLNYADNSIGKTDPLDLASLIHPDDLNLVSDHYQHFTTLQAGEVIAVNYRMKRADGTWCWLRSQETPLLQADGFPHQILGIVQVMTPRVPSLEDLLGRADANQANASNSVN